MVWCGVVIESAAQELDCPGKAGTDDDRPSRHHRAQRIAVRAGSGQVRWRKAPEGNDRSRLSHQGNNPSVARHKGFGGESHDERHSGGDQLSSQRIRFRWSNLFGIVDQDEWEPRAGFVTEDRGVWCYPGNLSVPLCGDRCECRGSPRPGRPDHKPAAC